MKLALPLLLIAAMVPAAAQTASTATTAASIDKLPSSTSSNPNDTVVEEIVARVNNAIVTRADLRRSEDQIEQEVKESNDPNPQKEIEQRQKDQLRDLINQQLLIQKGQDLGISVDTELVKRLDEIRKQVGAKDMEELQQSAEKQGVNWEDFKNNLKNQMMSQRVIQQEVGSKVGQQITPAEIQKYYDEHKSEMEQPERVRLSEILVPVETAKTADGKDDPSATSTPEAVAAAEAKANSLKEQIKKGAAFEAVAKANSAGPTAANGGDLGYFKRGSLAKELEDKTFALNAGDVTDPIRTKQGFVILKVVEHAATGVPPLMSVEGGIQERLYYAKLNPALQDYFKHLREDAYIYVKDGYVDTGKVAGQTGPVFTEDTTKNKKAKEQATKKKKKKLLGVIPY
jgi:peptidyl-prolyl cis-trans isomerase SurA